MLGELIYEGRGKRTARTVLPLEGTAPRIQVSFEETGKLVGIEANFMGTYWAAIRSDGSVYGEGQGIIATREGDSVSLRGIGTGKVREGGAVSYRGSIIFHAPQKLARLNTVAGAFEFEVDAQGNTSMKMWEWK
jgi:hypothetical protein